MLWHPNYYFFLERAIPFNIPIHSGGHKGTVALPPTSANTVVMVTSLPFFLVLVIFVCQVKGLLM
jgi:hypothetical protein